MMDTPPSTQPFAPRTRRERNRAEMRQAILDAARAVMREDGVAALNLNKVAARLGMRPPSLYEYFDGKPAIYDALFRLGMELFAARNRPILDDSIPPLEQLRGGMETYLQFALDYPELYQLCFERPVPGFVPSEESMRVSLSLLGETYAMAAKFFPRPRRGKLARFSTQQLVDLTIAMMHGLTAQHMANEPQLPMGKGRYGSLIPAAVSLFECAIDEPAPRRRAKQSKGTTK
jgi:AcrR family transcriptional regulator